MNDEFLAYLQAELFAEDLWESTLERIKDGELKTIKDVEEAFKLGVISVLAVQYQIESNAKLN